jgi:hypothetical protein
MGEQSTDNKLEGWVVYWVYEPIIQLDNWSEQIDN